MEPKDRATILWNLYKEECDWLRHNETQRGSLTTVLLAVYGGILAFLPKDRPLGHHDWPLPGFMMVLGLVGVLSILKYWERFNFHGHIRRRIRQELDSLVGSIEQLREQGKADHNAKRFLLNDNRFMQHWLWIGVHTIAGVLGLWLLCVALFSSRG
jgi:hypothetical protein